MDVVMDGDGVDGALRAEEFLDVPEPIRHLGVTVTI